SRRLLHHLVHRLPVPRSRTGGGRVAITDRRGALHATVPDAERHAHLPRRALRQRRWPRHRRPYSLQRRPQHVQRPRARRRDERRGERRLLRLLEGHPTALIPYDVRNYSSSNTEISGALPLKPYSFQRFTTWS